MKKRILAIDDEVKILEVVCSYLEHAGHVVVTASTGRSGLELFGKREIDMVVLDLMLPDITGQEVCRLIRRQSNLPILMLTAKVEEESLLQGFNIGADDYLTKPFSPRELVVRASALLKRCDLGKDTVSGSGCRDEAMVLSDDGVFVLDPAACIIRKNNIPLDLTATEFQLLAYFLHHQGWLFSRQDLVPSILGDDFSGDPRTIDAHIKNLRHKIESDPKAPDYIHTVHGLGYRFGKA